LDLRSGRVGRTAATAPRGRVEPVSTAGGPGGVLGSSADGRGVASVRVVPRPSGTHVWITHRARRGAAARP